jgi:hypothetical protein
MSGKRSTVQRLEHEIVYLEQNKIPITNTGELITALDYDFKEGSADP